MIENHQLEATKSALSEILTIEGYRPRRTQHNDVEFKVEGMTHILDFDNDDPAYVRLLLPFFWSIEKSTPLFVVHEACNHTNALYKGVKIIVMDEKNVWAFVEFLVASNDTLSAEVVHRQISMIRAGVDAFEQKLQELLDRAAAATISNLRH